MGIGVLILGESGAGKSTSMRNFKKGEVGIFNVAGKPLPFRGNLDRINNATYPMIQQVLQKHTLKRYVIDDSQALMAFELFDKVQQKGYDKFTEIAVNFKNILDQVRFLPPDVVVYFMHHTEMSDTGRIKAKTVGKMLDNQLTIEGLFSIVLLAKTDGHEHWFETQSDGMTSAKSPMGMFENRIDNDLKFVDEQIRKYWELDNIQKEKKESK